MEGWSGRPAFIFGFTVHFASIIAVMSLEPQWSHDLRHDSLWGPRRYGPGVFIASWCGVAARKHLSQFVMPAQFQDLSVSCCVCHAWALLEFSQFLSFGAVIFPKNSWYSRRMEGVWGQVDGSCHFGFFSVFPPSTPPPSACSARNAQAAFAA